MVSFDFDLFTIGAGSGGVAASRRAALHGARVALCESGRIGGTCVLRGCVPKKLLVYGTHYRDEIEDARGFGWTVEGARFDWAELIRRKDRELERLSGIYSRLLHDAGVTVAPGAGRVIDPHTVEVAGRRYTARHILIATGGRPVRPELPGIAHAITSDEALSLEEVPKRLVVIGGGYIGVELAGVFRAAGAEVTVLIRDALVLRGFDMDIRVALTEAMQAKGIVIRAGRFFAGIDEGDGALEVRTSMAECIGADAVLVAMGRVPSTSQLGLVDAGVELDARGAVVVDAFSRTRVPSIHAVGDCTNRVNLTPVAIAEGRALAETLFHDNPTAIDHTSIATAVFTQPPIASVGLTELEAAARPSSAGGLDVYLSRFRPMKHTLSGRDSRTTMKLIVDRQSDVVLGCHVLGDDAPEIIQGFALALRLGVTKRQLDGTLGIHPTAAEELFTMRDKRPELVPAHAGPPASVD